MTSIERLIETLRGDYIDAANKKAAEEMAEQRQNREDAIAYIDRMIAQPWREAAAAAGIPADLAGLAAVEIAEDLNLYDPVGGGRYSSWEALTWKIPGCHPIYIFPAGGSARPISDAENAQPPDRWHLYVSRPIQLLQNEFWEDGDDCGPFYLRRSWPEAGYHSYDGVGSQPEIADWRIVIGYAATQTPYEMELIADCERENTQFFVDRDRQREEEQRDPMPPAGEAIDHYDMATAPEATDAERLIAAVLHLAGRIEAIEDRISTGITTWPGEY